ncbi:hypothetical protein SK128_000942 [Halocaridina rubra]|uniref:Uncharacterized protein n=1 Tax=Halocaridina rubra TaxID=373956 RepID=A0AAN8XAW7_HALRR
MVQLKQDLSLPPGSTPYTYDRGLDIIKGDICSLKSITSKMDPAVKSITNFSSWLQSMQEIVNQQTEDFKKIENYLMRFGYSPTVEISSTSTSKTETAENIVSSDRRAEVHLMCSMRKTELKADKKSSTNHPQIHLASMHSSEQVNNATKTLEYQNTPLTTRAKVLQSYCPNSCGGSSYRLGHIMTVEQWMYGNESNNFEITPDVLPMKRRNREERDKINKGKDCNNVLVTYGLSDPVPQDNETSLDIVDTPVIPQTNNPLGNLRTPDEPALSEYTTQFLFPRLPTTKKENKFITEKICKNSNSRQVGSIIGHENNHSEQPARNITEKSCLNHGESPYNPCSLEDNTPEEPLLSKQSYSNHAEQTMSKTPEELVLSCHASIYHTTVDLSIMKEPVLLHQKSRPVSSGLENKKTPEEPIISYQSMEQVITKNNTKTPEEPVLSSQCYSPITTMKEDIIEGEKLCSSRTNVMNFDGNMPSSPQLSDITRSILSFQNQGYKMPPDFEEKAIDRFPFKQDKTTCLKDKSDIYGRSQFWPQTKLSPRENKFTYERKSEQEERKWHHQGTSFERYLGIDDIPTSPQLSETTQKLCIQKY